MRIGAHERVEGDVVVLGGPVTVNGSVSGDVVVLGGPVASTAALHRGLHEVGFDGFDFGGIECWRVDSIQEGARCCRPWLTSRRLGPRRNVDSLVPPRVGGQYRGVRGAGECRACFREIGSRAGQSWNCRLPDVDASRSVFILSILLLVVSIIEIPLLVLLPFAIIGVLVAMVVGFAWSAHGLGGWLGRRLGRGSQPIYVSVWFGIALILLPAIVGKMLGIGGGPLSVFAVLMALTGALVEYATWTTGLEALVLNRFGSPLSRQGISPPASLPHTEPHVGMPGDEPGSTPG